MKLDDIRKSYQKFDLIESQITKNPIVFFKEWLSFAINSKIEEPTAMILSTVSSSGVPSSRVVLLKDFSEKGFVFYTNYLSRKSNEMNINIHVSLLFFWPELERQIRIIGKVSKLSNKESSLYFNSRPFESRIGAIVSKQSTIAKSRELIDSEYEITLNNLNEKLIKKPIHWGGYIVKPYEFEFWQGRPNRMHDRIQFILKKKTWEVNRLWP